MERFLSLYLNVGNVMPFFKVVVKPGKVSIEFLSGWNYTVSDYAEFSRVAREDSS